MAFLPVPLARHRITGHAMANEIDDRSFRDGRRLERQALVCCQPLLRQGIGKGFASGALWLG